MNKIVRKKKENTVKKNGKNGSCVENGNNGKNGKTNKKLKQDIKIRTMEIDDIAQAFHLGERLFTHDESPNLYRTWDEYEVVEFFTSEPDLCLVAALGETIVGFVLATTIEKRKSAWKYGYLVWIGVDDKHQGRRIGSRLYREFLSIMEDERVRMLLVDIDAENEEGYRFFKKQGFHYPQEHIYLSLNLSARDRKEGKE
jgi:ribosomal protein S18 acetylase RimI-like enzyme